VTQIFPLLLKFNPKDEGSATKAGSVAVNICPMESPQIHGPWKIVHRNSVYHDPWMDVRMDNVIRPDGLLGTYSTVRIKAGVCVIPVDDDGICYLTKEFHYAVGRDTIEGISGGIEENESAESAAARELQEEVGILADKLTSMGIVDPLTAALHSPTNLFLATGLSFTTSNMEGTEQIERVAMPLNQALQMVMASQITHGPSCVAIMKASLLYSEPQSRAALHHLDSEFRFP
jgi:ADP-ribose pyrophosphatase